MLPEIMDGPVRHPPIKEEHGIQSSEVIKGLPQEPVLPELHICGRLCASRWHSMADGQRHPEAKVMLQSCWHKREPPKVTVCGDKCDGFPPRSRRLESSKNGIMCRKATHGNVTLPRLLARAITLSWQESSDREMADVVGARNREREVKGGGGGEFVEEGGIPLVVNVGSGWTTRSGGGWWGLRHSQRSSTTREKEESCRPSLRTTNPLLFSLASTFLA